MKATTVENKQFQAWNTVTNEFGGTTLNINTYKSVWVFYTQGPFSGPTSKAKGKLLTTS